VFGLGDPDAQDSRRERPLLFNDDAHYSSYAEMLEKVQWTNMAWSTAWRETAAGKLHGALRLRTDRESRTAAQRGDTWKNIRLIWSETETDRRAARFSFTASVAGTVSLQANGAEVARRRVED